jgi:NADH-quinone oxidoreductase subunit L
MQALEALFPIEDFTLLAIIVVLPLLGAVVNGVFGKRLGREAATLMGLGTVFLSFLLSVATFLRLADLQEGEKAARLFWRGWQWVTLSLPGGTNSFPVDISLSVDALSATMSLVVTGVGFLIHLYSSKYMEEDAGYERFFCYLNLFIFSMLVLIFGDSLPVLFVGWEGVGLCSYLLIGFWYQDTNNAAAGKKAFITNRIGDFGLLIAMGLLVNYTGALDWKGIEAGAGNLLQPVQLWPFGSHVPLADKLGSFGEWLNAPRHVSAATLVGLALFLGCAGKSAQIPLYVWLPDAMAGPTPVSALIHAATMVTAGVYLVCRLSFVFVLSPAAMFTVALVGALTAFVAALMAFAQNDIKKVLAYSTVSQLGYMFLGVGVGAFTAGFFHVVTHAFFKACMFLGAGSVIHAMHARIHDTARSQDMRNMGGLHKYMPYTFWTFAVAWAAIVGFPMTSGFFSKDEILLKAFTSQVSLGSGEMRIGAGRSEIELFQWPAWGGSVLYGLGFITAVCTAFYMTRLLIGIFFGEFRGWKIVKGYKPSPHDHHDDHGHGAHHEELGVALKGPKPHESPPAIWVPLVVLAALAAFAGFLNAHLFHLHPFDDWLNPVFQKAAGGVKLIEGAEGYVYPLLGLAVLAFVGGVGSAYYVYVSRRGEPAQRFVEAAPGLHRFAEDKFRVDEFYEETVIGSVDSLAEVGLVLDKWVVDGIVARFTAFVVGAAGSLLRFLQNGRVQAYSLAMLVGVGLVGWLLLSPSAQARTRLDEEKGLYSVTAAPGLGYSYRWDANGDGQWDSNDFGTASEVSVTVEVAQRRTVRLEVMNAFGRTASTDVELERPKPDRSGPAPERAQAAQPAPAPDDPELQRNIGIANKALQEVIDQAKSGKPMLGNDAPPPAPAPPAGEQP